MRTFALLLLVLWLSRLPGLEALPLHNDEGLHLTRAVEVWNGHPFWEIRDGKIINHWAIALFYPQNAPVFVGRIATVLVTLVGFAAGYALMRRLFGATAALLAGALWIASPYLFFFDRLALSDAEAGALVVLALLAGWRLAERGSLQRAVVAGLTLALAALFKFTAAPFAVSIALIVLLRARYSFSRRVGLLLIVGVVVALCFAVPVGYLLVRGEDLFSIALGWISGGANVQGSIGANLAMLGAQLVGFSLPIWSFFLLIGLVLLLALRPRTGGMLLLAAGVPLALMVVLGREVLPRHYVAALPALLILGGGGIGVALDRWRTVQAQRQPALLISLAALAFGFIPFALHAYTAPDQLRVPDAVWTQYFSEHSSGYGLREAVEALPETVPDIHFPILGSMTADSCRRANFYAFQYWTMRCPGELGGDIQTALSDSTVVYVVVDAVTGAHFPQDAEALGAEAEQIAIYPRPTHPGEAGQPITLWRLERAP